jgi:hypothetical protein
MDGGALLNSLLGGEWKAHGAHPAYFFSREGHAARLRSDKRGVKVTLLKGCSCGRGYRAISYPNGCGRYGRLYIHRAVCELFNGPCPEGQECRHLDGNPTNNRASNLAWGTPTDNSRDKIEHGTNGAGESNPMARLTAAAVSDMRRMRAETGASYKQLGMHFGVSTMTAFRATTERAWK